MTRKQCELCLAVALAFIVFVWSVFIYDQYKAYKQLESRVQGMQTEVTEALNTAYCLQEQLYD